MHACMGMLCYIPNVVGASTSIEAGIEAASTTQNSCSGVDDTILGDKALGWRGWGGVGEDDAE